MSDPSNRSDAGADDRIFMMGEFEASFPSDRLYAKNHMWAQAAGDVGDDAQAAVFRFGFTAYAVRLLQDVYFLDWECDDGTTVTHRQTIGAIESKKAESDLFAPLTGVIATFNPQLLDDPSAINVDKYEAGWLFQMQGIDHSVQESPLLTVDEYIQHLHEVWEVTQRTIKGQLNQ